MSPPRASVHRSREPGESDGLDSPRDGAFQRRDWTAQRCARITFTGIILAALLGLLGSGPASHAVVQNAGLHVAYERVARSECRFVVSVVARSDAVSFSLREPRASQGRWECSPMPAREVSRATERLLTFDAIPGEPLTITVWWTPSRWGLFQWVIETQGDAVDARVLVLP